MMKYTPNEEAFLRILKACRGEKITTTRVAEIRYPLDDPDRPNYPREAVVCILNTLMRKVKKNGEPFRIMKSKRFGPNPSSYWIEGDPGAVP